MFSELRRATAKCLPLSFIPHFSSRCQSILVFELPEHFIVTQPRPATDRPLRSHNSAVAINSQSLCAVVLDAFSVRRLSKPSGAQVDNESGMQFCIGTCNLRFCASNSSGNSLCDYKRQRMRMRNCWHTHANTQKIYIFAVSTVLGICTASRAATKAHGSNNCHNYIAVERQSKCVDDWLCAIAKSYGPQTLQSRHQHLFWKAQLTYVYEHTLAIVFVLVATYSVLLPLVYSYFSRYKIWVLTLFY